MDLGYHCFGKLCKRINKLTSFQNIIRCDKLYCSNFKKSIYYYFLQFTLNVLQLVMSQ